MSLIGSERLYSGRIVNLDRDTVRFPDGSTGQLEMLRHPGAAAVVPFLDDPGDPDPRLLLIRQFRHAADGFIWEIPAGRLDAGESPERCAHRELEEETGYRAGRVEHLITFQPMVGMVDSEHLVFTGRDPEKLGEPTETTEVERMEWVPLASVPGLIAAGEIWNSGTLVALLRLLMPQG